MCMSTWCDELLMCYLCVQSVMDDRSCDADVLLTAVNNLDNRAAKQQVKASHPCELACVLCNVAASLATSHLKLLPCLHIVCHDCLVQFLLDKSLPSKDTDFAASIFACPCCSYTTQLPCDGVAGLSDASFLQSVDSCAVMSDAAESDTQCLGDSEGHKQIGVPLLSHATNCGADDANVKRTPLSLRNLTQSSMGSSHSPDNNPLTEHTGDSKHVAATSQVSSANSEKPSHCGVSGDDGLTLPDETDSLTRSQILSLSLDAVGRQHGCRQTMQQIKLAAQELDARKIILRNTISMRADYLCKLICSRRDQLFDDVDREHAQSAAMYSESISVVSAYSRSLEDSCQFAGAMLAAKDVSTEVESDVAARLNQLIHCDSPGVRHHSDMTQVTAMRLDVPDAQHEESHLEKLFGSVVKGTVGAVEFLRSFHTDLQWPTGFVVTHNHDSVLAGKAGAFADEGQVLFYDCHGSCVHCHRLSAGHLPVSVVTVSSGDVLVSDVSGHVTKFSSSGRLIAEWSDMFKGPGGHMAVNGSNEVLVTSSSECCIHRYREVDGQRVATFSLQWPDDTSNRLPDITAISVNSNEEVIVTASNFHDPYFFTADGHFLHCSSTTPAADHIVKAHTENGLNTGSVALPSAVCCDSFDNVLVADFLGNCVHLLSSSGSHLGRLLTKTHGVACPNFVALDQDGRLYVGQYGGDVLVFRYLSYVKHV